MIAQNEQIEELVNSKYKTLRIAAKSAQDNNNDIFFEGFSFDMYEEDVDAHLEKLLMNKRGVYFKVSEGKANLLKKINYGEERFHKNSRGKVA